jgi:hypothetical protein
MVLAPFLFAAAPVLIAHDDDDRRDRGRYDDRYGNGGWRGPVSRGGSPYAAPGYRRGNPVEVSLRDLQSIRSRSRVDDHESRHFRRAIEELLQFDERARRGKFDRGSLDDAIDNMEHLADARQIHPRDRDRLREDLFALRALRSRGDWR